METSLAERLQRVQMVHGWTDPALARGICHPDTVARSRDDRGEMHLSSFVAIVRRLLHHRVTELAEWLLESTPYCLALRGTGRTNGNTDDDAADVCDAATEVRRRHREGDKPGARAAYARLLKEVSEMGAEVERMPDTPPL